jgi:hypothetical protein
VIFEVPTKNAADSLAAIVPARIRPHFDGVKSVGSIIESGINAGHKSVYGFEAESFFRTGGIWGPDAEPSAWGCTAVWVSKDTSNTVR